MDENVHYIIELANKNRYYNIKTIVITVMLWISTSLIQSTMGFLELMPIVEFNLNKMRNLNEIRYTNTTIEATLNHTICTEFPDYKIKSVSGHSLVSYLNIQCDKFNTSLLSAVFSLASLIGLILTYLFEINFGMRRSIIIFGFIYSLLLLITTLINDIFIMILLLFCVQMSAIIVSFFSYMYLNEVVTTSLNSIGNSIVQCGFNISGLVFVFFYNYFDSWKITFIICSLFNLIAIIFFILFLYESPLSLLKKKDFNSFIIILNKISIENKCQHEFNRILEIQSFSKRKFEMNESESGEFISKNKHLICYYEKVEKLYTFTSNKPNDDTIILLKDLKKSKYFFLLLAKLSLIWFTIGGIYLAISINLKNLKGNVYSSASLLNLTEIFIYPLTGLIIGIPKIGSKGSLLIGFFSSLFVGSYILMSHEINTKIVLFLRIIMAWLYNSVYIYSGETYNLKVKNIGMSYNVISGNLGGMVFSYIVEYYNDKFIIMTIILLSSLCIAIILSLPKNNKKLDDSNDIDERDHII